MAAYHSEYVHNQQHGYTRIGRRFRANDTTSTIETQLATSPWTFLNCPNATNDEEIAHNGAIIIAVDGACRNNGRPNAQAAAGVFFHPNNFWNSACLLSTDMPQTNQRAELCAALMALNIAVRIRGRNDRIPCAVKGPYRKLKRVVVKTDSDYLVQGMTKWVHRWKKHGFMSLSGRPVINADLFEQLETVVKLLHSLFVKVQFWRVDRSENVEADRLANAALDGVAVGTYS